MALSLNIPVSQPSPKPESLTQQPIAKAPVAKESAPPAPLNGAPKPQPSKLHLADTFVSAPAKSSAPQLQVPPSPSQIPAPAPKGTPPTNVAADDQVSRGWSGGAAGAVQQDTPTGCGTANLATICNAAHGALLTPEQHQNQVRQNAATINNSAALNDRVKVDLKDGATADEMAALLGLQGQKVVRGFDTFSADYMNGALQQGQFGLTLLDSTALRNGMLPPEKRTNEPGALHWVTVDGIDDRGTPDDYSDDVYRVKDPIHGEYWVKEEVLKGAVAQARAKTGSGGVLVVENEPNALTQEALEALARQNLNHTAAVGKGNGIGSRPTTVLEPS
ncbi:MAG TPA: hypothetical protein VNA24_04665 [Hyalangium sp.]|nr:hypothetical protein [Hyalangium sp.]